MVCGGSLVIFGLVLVNVFFWPGRGWCDEVPGVDSVCHATPLRLH